MSDAEKHIRLQRKVYSAYLDAWVELKDEIPTFRRHGREVVFKEREGTDLQSALEEYKVGMASGKMNQKIQLTCPTNEFVLDYIEANARLGLPVIVERSAIGRTVYICGNGRGLPDHAKHIEKHGQGDDVDVWGCNGAANWLHNNGVKLTHAFTTDTSKRMWEECWADPPPAVYLIATCADTQTINHIMAAGHTVVLFHNFTGIQGEIPRYLSLYPTAPLVGEGLNSVNRALALADAMGFEKIYLAGAVKHLDPQNKSHHADGRPSNQQYTLAAQIDGRRYATHADLLYSAVDLVMQERAHNGTLCRADWRKLEPEQRKEYEYKHDGTYMPRGRKKRLEILGDKRDLGMMLRTKPKSFLDRCITFGGNPNDDD